MGWQRVVALSEPPPPGASGQTLSHSGWCTPCLLLPLTASERPSFIPSGALSISPARCLQHGAGSAWRVAVTADHLAGPVGSSGH